jgi:hypothetical protein
VLADDDNKNGVPDTLAAADDDGCDGCNDGVAAGVATGISP